MGAIRALVTVKLPSGAIVYLNDAGVARDFVAALPLGSSSSVASGPHVSVGNLSQRLAVISAGLRIQSELTVDEKPLPCLTTAIRALRLLNKSVNDAKHLWDAPSEAKEGRATEEAEAQVMPETGIKAKVTFTFRLSSEF